ncbi:hypothetical protein NHX12_002836 [Muraenolepis orangiensis]|uniref:Uncharacterized protein n=1 Tax=Muraenolepis orangiensis TaxID=630683 RepID=A0A9Q0DXT7_9TELE|nr:hypothetical protein NHX12_002836 [Muraenolepis orangiensis]
MECSVTLLPHISQHLTKAKFSSAHPALLGPDKQDRLHGRGSYSELLLYFDLQGPLSESFLFLFLLLFTFFLVILALALEKQIRIGLTGEKDERRVLFNVSALPPRHTTP